jgi:hypothetical protein
MLPNFLKGHNNSSFTHFSEFSMNEETAKHSDFVVVEDPDELCSVPDESHAEGNDPDARALPAIGKGQDEPRNQTGAILHCRLVITVALQNGAQGESTPGVKAMSKGSSSHEWTQI